MAHLPSIFSAYLFLTPKTLPQKPRSTSCFSRQMYLYTSLAYHVSRAFFGHFFSIIRRYIPQREIPRLLRDLLLVFHLLYATTTTTRSGQVLSFPLFFLFLHCVAPTPRNFLCIGRSRFSRILFAWLRSPKKWEHYLFLLKLNVYISYFLLFQVSWKKGPNVSHIFPNLGVYGIF